MTRPGTACGTVKGTVRGYWRHKDNGEQPCQPCYDARLVYKQDKRLAPQRRAILAEAVGGGSYGGRSS